jgi:hypothetical protein
VTDSPKLKLLVKAQIEQVPTEVGICGIGFVQTVVKVGSVSTYGTPIESTIKGIVKLQIK